MNKVRQIKAKVELFEGSTLTQTFTYTDRVKEITIERIGEESKFFGFGVFQKINVKLIDKDRELTVSTKNNMVISFAENNENYISNFPTFYISEVHRDENTNEISITAYDILNKSSKRKFDEITIKKYTIKELAAEMASKIGLTLKINISEPAFERMYENGGNFEGTETFKDILDDIAEATQTIYYVNNKAELVFTRLGQGEVYNITKEDYITLKSRTNRRLAAICHTTQLGDNIIAEQTYSGTTQFVRDNGFWELRTDIQEIVEAALAAIGGLTMNQFDLNWRGNTQLNIGQKIGLSLKDNNILYGYCINDKIIYAGGMKETTSWHYNDEEQVQANPTNLGEAVKKTYANVDKINKQIDIIASDVGKNKEDISGIQITTSNINASVNKLEEKTKEDINGVNRSLNEYKTSMNQTAKELQIDITNIEQNGVSKIETSKGYTFNDEGLKITKSNSEMTTQITEDGMTVKKDNKAMLTANNKGVDAENLHATTYLIIGNHCRFEDFGSNRTACFYTEKKEVLNRGNN